MKHLFKIFFLLSVQLLFSQQIEYKVQNTSINSEYAEFGTTYINNNQILFASSNKIEDDKNFKKERRKNNRQLFLELYKATITNNGDLKEVVKFSDDLNNKFYESDIAFTPDFKTIYFTWNNFYDTKKRTDSAKWKPLYLFRASIDQNLKVSNFMPLTFNSKNYSLKNPKVSKDGKKLYFASDMPGGYGGFDIYVVDIFPNGGHSAPKNLGPNVNTNFNELYPFVDENNTLYFSSYGHKGYGKLDIFKSEYIDNKFQKAIDLPAPINSSFDDFSFVIDQNSGYFSSNRKKGKGDVDIYSFKSAIN